MNQPTSLGSVAVVIGADGGIGRALYTRLQGMDEYTAVIGLSRASAPRLELTDEKSIESCAEFAARHGRLKLVLVATGLLHGSGIQPEKNLRELNASSMTAMFAANAIGPALVLKSFLPLLTRGDTAVLAVLSARLGSIADNKLGGWYSYRSSKAALNQLIRTAAVELKRCNNQGICVALHPGTVDTRLSAPFGKSGLKVLDPEQAAVRLLDVISRLSAADSGCFFDHRGEIVPW
jgi:NAD(P)-dependent dehydrogenase (short-subunit alcohol dehydrogenase family)